MKHADITFACGHIQQVRLAGCTKEKTQLKAIIQNLKCTNCMADERSRIKKAQWDPETLEGRELRRKVSEGCKGKGRHNKIQGEDRTMRTCLTCSREFISNWKGNRICPRCKQTDLYQYHCGLNEITLVQGSR